MRYVEIAMGGILAYYRFYAVRGTFETIAQQGQFFIDFGL